MIRPRLALFLGGILLLALLPVQAQIPTGDEGPGFQGASTCYDPTPHLTRWTRGEFTRNHYVDYFWLPNKQENVTWTCEKFDGGLRANAPVTASYPRYAGPIANDAAHQAGRLVGLTMDFDGDGHQGPVGVHHRIIPDVGNGTHFVLHGWSSHDLYTIGFYDDEGRKITTTGFSYAYSKVAGDIIGQVPPDAAYARVTQFYPGWWSSPGPGELEALHHFDYYEVTFQGENLCPTGDPDYRQFLDLDNHMQKVIEGNRSGHGWVMINYTYEAGSPMLFNLYQTMGNGQSHRYYSVLADGKPRGESGGGGGTDGPVGTAVLVGAPNQREVGYDGRTKWPHTRNKTSTAWTGPMVWGVEPGNYSVLMWSWAAKPIELAWNGWVDTCGEDVSRITGVSSGSEISYSSAAERRDRVDVQVRTPHSTTWAVHTSVEAEADHNLYAFLRNVNCVSVGWSGVLWPEPWRESGVQLPVQEHSGRCTHRLDAEGPPGTWSHCYRYYECVAVGPAGSYEIDATYVGNSGWPTKDGGLFVLDVQWP